jgi:hypothetical protein
MQAFNLLVKHRKQNDDDRIKNKKPVRIVASRYARAKQMVNLMANKQQKDDDAASVASSKR